MHWRWPWLLWGAVIAPPVGELVRVDKAPVSHHPYPANLNHEIAVLPNIHASSSSLRKLRYSIVQASAL